MFMGPGMIEFFVDMKQNLVQQGFDEAAFRGLFSGLRGIVVLDTCSGDGGREKLLENLGGLGMSLEVLEVREVGLGGVLRLVLDAVGRV
jgi:hypothetical protein